jgi:SAM-dependent methyltransferase
VADLESIYDRRFPDADVRAKDRVWREISRYLQRWVPEDGVVLDIACDRGYFIRNIVAGEKWASDIRDMSADLGPSIRFVQASGLDLDGQVPLDHFDAVFMSNYLEHLASPDEVLRQLAAAARLVRPGGRVIVLQPNIRLVGGRYWDFIDHRVALTERSLEEAASAAGLETEAMHVRFLPYSTKGRLPADARLVRAYLRVPLAWRVLGKQTLYVGRRPEPRGQP